MRKGNDRARKGIKHLPVATGGMSRLAYKHALAAGTNLEAQLHEAGLTRAQIENPHAPIKVRDQIKFSYAEFSCLMFSDSILLKMRTAFEDS